MRHRLLCLPKPSRLDTRHFGPLIPATFVDQVHHIMSFVEAVKNPERSRSYFAIGLLLGLFVPLILGEAYVRVRPPVDIQEYLGESSPLTGIYRPDAALGVDYRSIGEYRPYEAPRFSEIEPLNTAEPTWLFFGNSFARGLSMTAREAMASHRILFFRESKDRLHMRIAQARMLLANGLKPERMIFTLIPIEIARYAEFPLSSVYVTSKGAITYRVRMPPAPFDKIVTHSRLALVAWIRSGLHRWNPTFRLSRITETIPDSVEHDFRHLFGEMGQLSQKYGVPITVVILPDRRQILEDQSKFLMQKTISTLAKKSGLDVFDPSEMLRRQPDRRVLYLPDWHYTPLGYGLLIDALRTHVDGVRSR